MAQGPDNVSKTSLPKRQHYVPQFLLRRFARARGKRKKRWQLSVFDKWEGRTYPSPVENAAAQNGFYNWVADDQVVSIETGLGDLETDAATVVKLLYSEKRLGALSRTQRGVLAYFAAIQLLRTPQDRYVRERMFADTRERFREAGFPAVHWDPSLDSEIARNHSIESVIDHAPGLAALLTDKHWVLFQPPAGSQFWVSDHPVGMMNHLRPSYPFHGNLGVGVPGIEIYLPLATDLVLGFFCTTVTDAMRSTAVRLRRVLESTSAAGDVEHSVALNMAANLEAGTPIPMTADNVVNLNALQVSNGFRYIYAKQPDFRLAEKMLADDPNFRRGPALQVD